MDRDRLMGDTFDFSNFFSYSGIKFERYKLGAKFHSEVRNFIP
jgi:hypothetical protein